ncbi:hypothetical protein [Streptomyces stackebrandtii]|uniref:hypothetical protein n=1 Tax=Streptomyces stackebrandtii TaxID=3051177 RepID=UPI0028DC7934|nr:hypothetical protein [Streptomyces sp. DSM 40976]
MADHTQGSEAAAAPARTAIYINRRSVLRIDIPVAHTMTPHNNGWRITFDAAGRLRAVMNEGHNDFIDVKANDFLLSSGEDFFISLQSATPVSPAADRAMAGEAR